VELDNRKKRILQAIVNEYINTIEPVSSNSIITKYGLDCSSATVRNEMVELERQGYLEKTHTSSGRVPSNKGYRFYVDKLLSHKELNLNEIKYINSMLQNKVDEMEELTKIATNTISEVTHYTTIAIEPDAGKQKIEEIKFVLLGNRMLMAVILTEMGTIKETIIKFDKDITKEQVDTLSVMFNNKLKGKYLSKIDIPMEQYIMQEMNDRLDVIKPIVYQITKTLNDEARIYLKGTEQALDNPEFKSNEIAKKFLGLLDRQDIIFNLLNSDDDFNIYIGNEINGLNDFSLITFKNKVGGKDLGTIGILGPTRMDYSKVVSVLQYINHQLNNYLDEGSEWYMEEQMNNNNENINANMQFEKEPQTEEEREIQILKQKNEEQRKDLEEYEDRIKRMMAEFENFKKRSDKERNGLYNSVMGDVITALLPVIDNLEKAVEAQTTDEQYKNGVEMCLKQFKEVLEKNGVTEIKSVGETFDPSLHEAVSLVTDDRLGEKVIKEEYRKGYMIGDKVLRHSLVIVAN